MHGRCFLSLSPFSQVLSSPLRFNPYPNKAHKGSERTSILLPLLGLSFSFRWWAVILHRNFSWEWSSGRKRRPEIGSSFRLLLFDVAREYVVCLVLIRIFPQRLLRDSNSNESTFPLHTYLAPIRRCKTGSGRAGENVVRLKVLLSIGSRSEGGFYGHLLLFKTRGISELSRGLQVNC